MKSPKERRKYFRSRTPEELEKIKERTNKAYATMRNSIQKKKDEIKTINNARRRIQKIAHDIVTAKGETKGERCPALKEQNPVWYCKGGRRSYCCLLDKHRYGCELSHLYQYGCASCTIPVGNIEIMILATKIDCNARVGK